MNGFWRSRPDGVSVTVKVQPKSRRPGIQGPETQAQRPYLRIGVTEPPENGRANTAVCAVLARALHVPLSAVAVAQGRASRDKTLTVQGDPMTLIAALETL